MQRLIQIVMMLVCAIMFEAVLRRIDPKQADVQEAAFLDHSVNLVAAILDEIPNVPPFIKMALVQPALIRPVAKLLDDAAEKEIIKVIDQVQGKTA